MKDARERDKARMEAETRRDIAKMNNDTNERLMGFMVEIMKVKSE